MRKIFELSLLIGLAALVALAAGAAGAAGTDRPSEAGPNHGPAYVEIMTTDLAKAEAFYGHLLGWHFESLLPGEATADLDGRVVATLQESPRLPNGQRVAIYFQVDHIDDAVAQALDNGGRLEEPAEKAGAALRAVVRDPDGTRVGLISAKR